MRKFLTESGPWIAAGLAGSYFNLSGWQWFQLFALMWLSIAALDIKATVNTLFEIEKLREKGEIAR